jgi:uncharacterized repeat protein (TIGR01451 family)
MMGPVPWMVRWRGPDRSFAVHLFVRTFPLTGAERPAVVVNHLLLRGLVGAAGGLCLALAFAGRAQAAPFVYVTNGGGNNVSQYDASSGALSPLSPPMAATGYSPLGVAVSPDAQSVYVADFYYNTVAQYSVGAGGVLSSKTPNLVASGSGSWGLAVSPDGQSVYVTNRGDNTVSQYSVGGGGVLSPKSPATAATGNAPLGVAVSPDGQSVYVTNDGESTVSQYSVGAGGVLSPESPATVATGGGPQGLAVSPDGQSVYVTNELDDTVSQYSVGAGGVLSPKAPATVASGSGPEGVAVSPDGQSVYVANDSDGTVSQYSVGAGGVLSPRTPATVAAGSFPVGVAVSPLTGADLSITKSGSPNPVISGQRLTYTITATNTGGLTASGVTVSDPLPANVHFGSVSTTQGSCTRSTSGTRKTQDGTVSCSVGSLAGGKSATITIVVTPTKPGTLTNTAAVSATGITPDGDDSATATTTVQGT